MKKPFLAALFAVFVLTPVIAQDLPDHDWAHFGRYAKTNASLTHAPKAVLMGDSITDAWYRMDEAFFTDHDFAGRGISGEVTSHMLVRFRRDVVDLHPKYAVILAGINDIARNNGYISLENTFGNIVSMCEIAKANKIKPVLCTLVPSDQIRWRPALGDVSDQVAALNGMIRAYAKAKHYKLVDYAKVLSDEQGVMLPGVSSDSVHPVLAGYKIMEEALLKVVK
ncbi:MAG: acylhydrolase [Bacteroidales bacterium]|nr:acylhydrolase [Bacteroidales bacterium]